MNFLKKIHKAMGEYKRGLETGMKKGLFGETLLRPEEIEYDNRQIIRWRALQEEA